MKSKKATLEVVPPAEKDRSLPILIAAVTVAVLANIVFYLTYPINAGQSDNPTFMSMIISGLSNLMHASGYPAIVHLIAYKILPILPPVASLTEVPSEVWFSRLQTFQFAVHLALFFTSIFLCVKAFNKAIAAVLAIGWGCNALFISNVDAIAPEWLQGHAVIISILMHAYARKLEGWKKRLAYSSAAVVFAFAYLIKFNSLLFAISLAAFLVFEKESWKFKVIQLISSAAIFQIVVWSYVTFYHYESTGTRHLTFDHAWVLTSSLPDDYETAEPDRLGTNSLRWAVLLRATPVEYFRAGGIDNVRFGPPPDLKQIYDEQWRALSTMTREEMIQFIKVHPLQPGYSHWAAAVPLYFYFGLERTDELGIQVYMESMRTHWWYHLKKIANSLATFFISGLKGIQTFPTFSDPIGYKFLTPDAGLLGKATIVPPSTASSLFFLEYYNPKGMVWLGGVRILDVLNRITSSSVLYLVLNLVAVAGLITLKSNVQRIAAFSLLISLLAFVSASGILLGLRQKEIIALTPAYMLMLSISICSLRRKTIPALAR